MILPAFTDVSYYISIVGVALEDDSDDPSCID